MKTDIESESEIRVERPGGCAVRSLANAAVATRRRSPGFLGDIARETRPSAND
jgi:hypothetical protein